MLNTTLPVHPEVVGSLLQNLKQLAGRQYAGAFGIALCLTVFAVFIISELFCPLRKYPGPFLARWTNLWRLMLVRTGRYHLETKKLHDKYGPVVRIGPNILDLDIPELIKTIYGTDNKWRKTEFYHNNSTIINGKVTYHLFSETDQAQHARMKRPIAKYYSQGSVLASESIMDEVLEDLCAQLDSRFVRGSHDEVCDLGQWIAFYSWDMNGVVSFSQRFGYMNKGCDFDRSIAIADRVLDYFSTVGQMPFLDFFLDKNPVLRMGPPNLGNVTRIALERYIARQGDKDINFDPKFPDFLQHFVDAKKTHPETVDDGTIIGYLLVNLIAGADTTAITIRTIFYHALKNTKVYRKLEEEIVAAKLGDVPSFSAVRALPYLEAVVREAMRMHPSISMLLERYVPDSGLSLPGGSYVPAGSIVGINPYVVHRNKRIWGEDADSFRPERWIRGHHPGAKEETADAYRERLRLFNASDLTFGGGSRICIGRSLALVEVYKLVATLIARYEIELVDPERDWEVTGGWFCRQKGLVCRLRARTAERIL